MRRILVIGWVLLAVAGCCLGQDVCSPAVAGQSAAAVAAVRAQLGAVDPEEMNTEVPATAQRLIPQLKAVLVETARAAMECHDGAVDASALETELATLLHANPPQPPAGAAVKNGDPRYPDWLSEKYGSNLLVSVTQPQPQMLSVKFEFHIACGVDRVWMVFEQQGAKWVSRLVWQAAPYSEVSGAFGDFFETAILPGDSADSWRAVVAHGTPWCTSNMSGFKIDLLAPARGQAIQRVVWHSEQGYRRESAPKLTLRPDGFELRLDVSTIETDVVIRKGIFRYRVAGDTVTRMRPIAVDGRGFVDAWLQAPWSDAKQWSLNAGLPTFAKVHQQFEFGQKDASVTYSYGPVRSCLMKGRYAVEIDAEPGGPEFYGIQEGADSYTMVDYSTAQDERCNEGDLMKKH